MENKNVFWVKIENLLLKTNFMEGFRNFLKEHGSMIFTLLFMVTFVFLYRTSLDSIWVLALPFIFHFIIEIKILFEGSIVGGFGANLPIK